MSVDSVSRLDDETERLTKRLEQSNAAASERDRQLTDDEYYGYQVLLSNGICPECLWTLGYCECGPAVDETEQYGEFEDDDD